MNLYIEIINNNVAYDYGFEYPEVFSRAFKKHYGITPIESRKLNLNIDKENKARVVERDLFNYGGGIAVKGNFIKAKEIELMA
ncbi:MAG: hypothetical protein CVV02_08625 [Firmicutes bacterium HGW-Firmicutes-7]|nr:MAG: hypothetical protein CVV02_08625 [Firmicutes bacterium HGW-Firmicutes-7]